MKAVAGATEWESATPTGWPTCDPLISAVQTKKTNNSAWTTL